MIWEMRKGGKKTVSGEEYSGAMLVERRRGSVRESFSFTWLSELKANAK
jgi:hypothetical protein